MNSVTHEILDLRNAELAILAELLESERARLLVEIRHTESQTFRDELRQRLILVKGLAKRFGPPGGTGPAVASEASIC